VSRVQEQSSLDYKLGVLHLWNFPNREIESERASPLIVAFVAFYRPPRNASTILSTIINMGAFNYIMRFLSLEVLYAVNDVTKSWPVEVP
jgi:hypothetical protein